MRHDEKCCIGGGCKWEKMIKTCKTADLICLWFQQQQHCQLCDEWHAALQSLPRALNLLNIFVRLRDTASAFVHMSASYPSAAARANPLSVYVYFFKEFIINSTECDHLFLTNSDDLSACWLGLCLSVRMGWHWCCALCTVHCLHQMW